jgi:hypothetical protein
MSDQVRVNGNQFSWGSIVARIDGEPYTGFTKVSFADSRERVKAYGMGRHHAPRGRSRGKYTVDPVTLTGWTRSVQDLRDALAAKASDGNSYGDVVFQIVVQYEERIGDAPITIELEDCVWMKSSTSNEESADPLTEDIEIDCLRIRRNGKVLFDETEGSA